MLLTQDRSLFWEAPCEAASRGGGGGREMERQKLKNLISSPLFPSPPLSSLSRLLSFPHVCLLAISLLSRPPAPLSLESPRTSFPPLVALICSRAPSSLISSLLYPISSVRTSAPSVTFLSAVPSLFVLVPICLRGPNLQICTHI